MALATALVGCGSSASGNTLTLARASGETVATLSYVAATTEQERVAGLAALPPLEAGQALLLIYPQETKVCVSNKDISYPIDVVFVNAEQTVQTPPTTLNANDPSVICNSRSQYVLETLAGATGRVQVGDQVTL